MLAKLFSHPLMRFSVAGLAALIITLILILGMRFLIQGYDDTATGTLMRHFTLSKLPHTTNNDEDVFNIERPRDQPLIPDLEDAEIGSESSTFIDESVIDIKPQTAPVQEIQANIPAFELNPANLSSQDKLKELKQEILSEDKQ
jgi:hypothetical protein